MSERAFDVLIMGGGIIGASIAYQLLSADPALKVGLIERKGIGAGSTSRSAAAFRHQFSSRSNILLSKVSYEVYKSFAESFNTDPSFFRENGYLFLYTREELLETAKARAAIQQDQGIPTQVFGPDDIEAHPRLKGFFNLEVIKGATFCARDGFLDPLLVAQTFYNQARDRGLTLIRDDVKGLIRGDDGGVTGAIGAEGRYAAGVVVNAMGWQTNRVLEGEGLALPILPVKRYLYITSPVRGTDVTGLPLIVCDLEPYMRPEAGNALMMGWDALPRVPSAESMKARHDYEAMERDQDIIDPEFTNDEYGLEVRVRMAEVVPLLESDQLKLFQETCGYYQITQDEKPILDRDPRAPGLIHACGFSGHGVMHAPAAGRYIADLIRGEKAFIERFDDGAFALTTLLEGRDRPDPEHMSI